MDAEASAQGECHVIDICWASGRTLPTAQLQRLTLVGSFSFWRYRRLLQQRPYARKRNMLEAQDRLSCIVRWS